MLRIAVVSRYFPSSGEPWQGRSAYQTIRALDSQAKVHVFYPNSAYPSFLRPRTRLFAGLDKSYSPPGVSVSYHDYPALPLISRPFNGTMAASALLPHVRAFRPDLIFSIFLYPDSYAALQIAKKLRVPLVAMGIGSDIHSIADRISERYTRTVLREADFLVTVSDDLRQKALAMGGSPERSRAVVNGSDLLVFNVRDRAEARRHLGLDPKAPIVVYIGRMDLRKGLRELVEASAKLRACHPDLHVYMVGEDPTGHRLRWRLKRLARTATSTLCRPVSLTMLQCGWVQPTSSPCQATWRGAQMLCSRPSLAAGPSSPPASEEYQRS
jgi:glycosyltransferase involved in cell wall biosynthesis